MLGTQLIVFEWLIENTALPQLQKLASAQNSPRRLFISIMKNTNGQTLKA
jgi:hypothetical protein